MTDKAQPGTAAFCGRNMSVQCPYWDWDPHEKKCVCAHVNFGPGHCPAGRGGKVGKRDLNHLMAKARGWTVYDVSPVLAKLPCVAWQRNGYYVVVDEHGHSQGKWQPETRVEQAMMVLEERFDNWALHRFPLSALQYECVIYPAARSLAGHSYRGEAQTKEEAICLAIAAAWKEEDDDAG